MNLEEIKEKLLVKFSAPLEEYYKRHIVFWNDPDKEFSDLIDELTIDGVKILKLSNNNYFEAKKLINEDGTFNILIYDSTNISERDKKHDWLADARIIYAKESITFDYFQLLMDKINIANESLKSTIKQYEKFWKNEERIKRFVKIAPSVKTNNELHLAILAVLVGAKSTKASDILFEIFNNGLDKASNKCFSNVKSYGSIDILWKVINKFAIDCQENLSNALQTILFSALYQTMGSALPNKLSPYKKESSAMDCYALLSEWTNNIDTKDAIPELIESIDIKMSLFDLFDAKLIDELIGSDLFPSINNAILRKLFTACTNRSLSGKKIKLLVAERKKMLWYDKYKNYYECLDAIGDLYEIYDKYAKGFHYVKIIDLWNDYQKEIYLFDTSYRHLHNAFYQTSLKLIDNIQDKLSETIQFVENLYKNFYLNNINDSWINLIKNDIDSTGKIHERIKSQIDFYDTYIENKCDDKLTIVIISDGMRYEIAKELSNSLQYQLKCNIKIDAMQGIFPSITKYGMASLLPGRKTIDDSMNVLVAQKSSKGLLARKQILQSRLPEADAIDYTDLFKMNSSEKKEFLKGKKVIYIYHNDIDNSGHDSAGESKVFDACRQSIDKIINLIKSLVNARGSIRIIVTSDHGFIYSYKKLDEIDKMSFTSDDIVDAEGEKRCIVTKNPVSSDFLVPVKLLINNDIHKYYGYAPLQAIRLKANGGVSNYVHGGLSLQEMMIPVIIFDNVRTNSKAYEYNKDKYDHNAAEIELVTNTDTFHGSIAKLEFYQTKPLGLDAIEATYDILFEDENGIAVSDTKEIIANKKDPDSVNRKTTVILSIKSSITTGTYYLHVFNHYTKETLFKKEFKLVNELGTGMFDF